MYSKLKQSKQEEFKVKTVIEADTQLKLFEVG